MSLHVPSWISVMNQFISSVLLNISYSEHDIYQKQDN